MTLGHFKSVTLPGPLGTRDMVEKFPLALASLVAPWLWPPWESSLLRPAEVTLTHSPARFQIVPKRLWAPGRAGTRDVTEESQLLEG